MPKRAEKRWWEFQGDERAPSDLPTPECFTDEEWGAYYAAEQQAIWNKKNIKTAIVRDMCSDCTLVYQKSQIKVGKCVPQYGAITPLHRMALILAGEEDPLAQENDTRGTPWAELPELRGAGIRSDQDGAGDEEGTTHAGDHVVLS